MNCIKKMRKISTYPFTCLRIPNAEGHVAMFTLVSFDVLFKSTCNLHWTTLIFFVLFAFSPPYLSSYLFSCFMLFLHFFSFLKFFFRPAHLIQNDFLLVFALKQKLKRNVMDFKQISYKSVIIYGDDIIKKLCKNLLFSVPQYLEGKTPELHHGQLPVTFT